MGIKGFACSIALMGLISSFPAHAGKANDTLVYASDSEPENISPYHNDLREGVILELGGRHGAVVRFLPPLTIDVAQVDTLVEKLQLALMASLAATKA